MTRTTLVDTAVEGIYNDLFESCGYYYGEKTIAPEVASAESTKEEDLDNFTPELGGEV